MTFRIKTNGSGVDYPTTPPGLHDCVCVDFVDYGWQERVWKGQKSSRYEIGFRFYTESTYEFENEDGELTERPYMVFSRRFGATWDPRGNLRTFIEGWLGRSLTQEDQDADTGLDLEDFVGRTCQIQIVHNQVDDKVYANIQAIIPGRTGYTPATWDYIRVKDREEEVPF
jgi:hypothetical protein